MSKSKRRENAKSRSRTKPTSNRKLAKSPPRPKSGASWKVQVDEFGIPLIQRNSSRAFVLGRAAEEFPAAAAIVLGSTVVVIGAVATIFVLKDKGLGTNALFAAVVTLCGLVFTSAVIVKRASVFRVKAPVITLAAAPAYIGERLKAVFEQRVKPDCRVNRIVVSVTCVEHYEYNGRNSNGEFRRMASLNSVTKQRITLLRGATTHAEDPVLRAEFTITIPNDGMHSLRLKHNRVDWYLETLTDLEGWPNDERRFKFRVAPKRIGGTENQIEIARV